MLFYTDGVEREETIHIFTEKYKKPFLGGFRHRLTNVEYHNASSQTYPKRKLPSDVGERFTFCCCGKGLLCFTSSILFI